MPYRQSAAENAIFMSALSLRRSADLRLRLGNPVAAYYYSRSVCSRRTFGGRLSRTVLWASEISSRIMESGTSLSRYTLFQCFFVHVPSGAYSVVLHSEFLGLVGRTFQQAEFELVDMDYAEPFVCDRETQQTAVVFVLVVCPWHSLAHMRQRETEVSEFLDVHKP